MKGGVKDLTLDAVKMESPTNTITAATVWVSQSPEYNVDAGLQSQTGRILHESVSDGG